MKYLDEFRDREGVQKWSKAIHQKMTRPWSLMEICGGQTHSIMKYHLTELWPKSLEMIHGPGCPVCVTSQEVLDAAIEIALLPNVIFTSFGDMLRVPGTRMSLGEARGASPHAADVRTVYSPMDALKLAIDNPSKEVVFFAIGFETTTAPNAMTLYQAVRNKVKNFSLLVSQVRVPPAMEVLLSSPGHRIQGLLAAGHVCTVMGLKEYYPLAEKYKLPIVVTGFEPMDILQGVWMAVTQLEEGRSDVEIQYSRVVRPEGNLEAQKIINEVFEPVDQIWRGLGKIPQSGFGIKKSYRDWDALYKFQDQILVKKFAKHQDSELNSELNPELNPESGSELSLELSSESLSLREQGNRGCISALILQGKKKPIDCPHFGTLCTPERPLGSPMVSAEGPCSAYFQYRTFHHPNPSSVNNN